jgi:hypothetical protein
MPHPTISADLSALLARTNQGASLPTCDRILLDAVQQAEPSEHEANLLQELMFRILPDHKSNPLRIAGTGYVYWRETCVEHFSGDNLTAMASALRTQCLHLEHLGIPVSSHTAVMTYQWYSGRTQTDCWDPLLVNLSGAFIHENGTLRLEFLQDISPYFEYLQVLEGKVQFVRRPYPSTETSHYRSHIHEGFTSLEAGQAKHNGLIYAPRGSLISALEAYKCQPDELVALWGSVYPDSVLEL